MSSEPSTRERISVEAARLFARRGYHGTSIADLAHALGIRKASVYSYINGKQDLLVEVTSSGAHAFHRALDGVPTEAGPGLALRLALRAHLGVVCGQLDLATVWLQEWRYLAEPARGRFVAERRRYEQRIRALFEAAVSSGEIDAQIDLRHAVLMFLSVGNWAYSWMTREADVDAEADAFWEIMLAGLQTEQSGLERRRTRDVPNASSRAAVLVPGDGAGASGQAGVLVPRDGAEAFA